ncbi:hypothetical protein ABN763_11570 [Spongiivirga sp. MCCC 1A20706]|uniref:hypothetical protein n=1 Tax=Spongiivirga sp. MCCC 1A20706 TaxID=3160963 RepID=UPI0039773062
MTRRVFSLIFLLVTFFSSAQMSNAKLNTIFNRESDSIQSNGNQWQMLYKDRVLLCVTDENANRMRIISPIAEIDKLDETELKNALVANFHTALDVKYAISDELIWSVFIHPLKELTEQQVVDALRQVYYANLTFGGSYSSTTLVFPGNTKKVEKESPIKKLKKI